MSRKYEIEVGRPMRVRDRDAAVMATVSRNGTISLTELGAAIGKNKTTAQRALKCCEGSGWVVTEHRTSKNGAQIENSYRLTDLGRRVLAAAQAAGIVE